MDLWIRSQDKMALAKYDLLILEHFPNNENKYIFIADHYKNMGVYKSKERALEILDEIQNILKPKFFLDASTIKEDGKGYITSDGFIQSYTANVTIEQLNTYVYEMPKE